LNILDILFGEIFETPLSGKIFSDPFSLFWSVSQSEFAFFDFIEKPYAAVHSQAGYFNGLIFGKSPPSGTRT
jgi:hypothetical protein